MKINEFLIFHGKLALCIWLPACVSNIVLTYGLHVSWVFIKLAQNVFVCLFCCCCFLFFFIHVLVFFFFFFFFGGLLLLL